MPKICLIVFLFILGQIIAQQNYSITGEVRDNENQPVPVGDILLLAPDHKTMITYTTILSGQFSFPNIPKGSYVIRVSCLGFQEAEKIIELDGDLTLAFKLEEAPTALSEVEVLAAKPTFSIKNGNIVMDLDNPVLTTISDPMELLSKLPTIQLSTDRESLTILGKGTPLLYLGNQQITLEEFMSLPIGDIQSIEIISNPSARYEAAGRAVILITRRENSTEGVTGNISETISSRQNFNNYLMANTSYSQKKVTYKANIGYNALQTWESHQFEFAIPARDIFTDYTVLIDNNNRDQVNFGTGIFYQLNETDYFSINGSLRTQTDNNYFETDTYLKQGTFENNITTLTGNDNRKDFGTANLNYNKSILPELNLFTGLQYTLFSQQLNSGVSNNYNGNGFELAQVRQQEYNIHVLTEELL